MTRWAVLPPSPPPPVPGGPSLDVVELAPGSFGMGPERARSVQLSRAFVVGLAQESVGGLSWFDAIRHCNALAEEHGLAPAYTLSEAEPRKAWSMDDMGRLVYDLLGFEFIQPVMERFGKDVLDMLQHRPHELKPVKGIGPKKIQRLAASWNPDEFYVAKVSWDFSSGGWRLPTEAEWEYAARTHADVLESGTRLEWVWDRAGKTWTNEPPPLSPDDAAAPMGASEGDKRVLRGFGQADVRRCRLPWERHTDGGLRVARWA
ncbi:MAG: SUMF1/EgtB/PvdO family nonheme iron enzyme [Proteobacteria bacterium]|nr:SUMF1/EgtB/PvdO family nonheme iron enzyme [Pseudomonadota bacterium]